MTDIRDLKILKSFATDELIKQIESKANKGKSEYLMSWDAKEGCLLSVMFAKAILREIYELREENSELKTRLEQIKKREAK